MLALGAVVVALAGCATSNELRGKGPEREYVSQKPSKDVAGCIADRLERDWSRGVSGRPTANGYTVIKEDSIGMWGNHTAMVVDIEDRPGGGSVAKAYTAWDIGGNAKTRLLGTVDDCK